MADTPGILDRITELVTNFADSGKKDFYDSKVKDLGLDPTAKPNIILTNLKAKLAEMENAPVEDIQTLGGATQALNQQKMVKQMIEFYARKQSAAPAASSPTKK